MNTSKLKILLPFSLASLLFSTSGALAADFSGYTKDSGFIVRGQVIVENRQQGYMPGRDIFSSSQAIGNQAGSVLSRALTAEEKKAMEKEAISYGICLNMLKDLGTAAEVAELCRIKGDQPSAVQPAAPSEEEIRQEIATRINQQFATLPLAPAQLYQDSAPNTLKNYNTNIYASAQPQEFVQDILGRQVTVRATPITYTFDYGDGSSLGPTTNPGYSVQGQWDVKTPTSHQYGQTGKFYYSVSTEFRGEYRVGDGNWQVIEGTASTSTEPQVLDVWKVRAGKVDDSCAENSKSWGC